MLKGKTAIITGGSRGIGKAIAIKLASLHADVAIIYAGNQSAAMGVCEMCRIQFNVKATAYCCDVADFDESQKAVANIKAEFGTVDILVNNAGITRDGLIAVMKETDFDDVIGVNLKGAFNMIRHCSPIFIKNRSGKIINISSVVGLTGNAGQSNYAASKAGLIGLTKSVARELAGRNITCNAIAPGFIQTDMTRTLENTNPMMAEIPLKRVGTPEEVAETAAFLAGNCSDYITGEVIRVDGGLAM
jgi:3-oxoacyl-[acyl-carrier protein] reductase